MRGLTQSISSVRSQNDKLEKWKGIYMQFLETFTKTN